MRTVREIEYNPFVEIGKYYAYESKGKLCVGQAIKNPNPTGYSWVMKNLNTGKIEHPYSQEVFITEEPCKKISLTYVTL
ncbi:MAG: hypothetical protein II927_00395 [Paludibacteraceae bacterium]|nr:hypothetical protein [Paludibacteraceae bacterium]